MKRAASIAWVVLALSVLVITTVDELAVRVVAALIGGAALVIEAVLTALIVFQRDPDEPR